MNFKTSCLLFLYTLAIPVAGQPILTVSVRPKGSGHVHQDSVRDVDEVEVRLMVYEPRLLARDYLSEVVDHGRSNMYG
jgi:hypothetical protein